MKLRAILLFLGLLAFFSASVGGYLYYSALKRSVLNEAEIQAASQAETIKTLLSSYLSNNLNTVRALAGLKEIQQAFVNPNEIALAEANFVLDNFNDSLGASVSYMMDQEGKTIASSNRSDRGSFVGKNYSFRPYFQEAIRGNPSIYMALGVTSKKRGLYYSYPVYERTEKSPMGVVILKTSAEATERELLSALYRAPGMFKLITGPHGVVFMSDHEKFLYRLLWKITDEERIKISKSKQFGKGPWEWAGFERRGQGRVVDKSGDEYLMFQEKIESLPGWNIVHLSNLETISERISTPFVRIVGYLTLIFCALIGLSVFILYRLAKSDIADRLKAEEALNASQQRLSQIINFLPDATMVIDLEGRVIAWNQAMEKLTGLKAQEMLGKGNYEYAIPFYGERRPVLIDIVGQWDKEIEKEYKYVKKEGESLVSETYDSLVRPGGYLWNKASLLYDHNGEVAGAIESIRDISDRKMAEKEKSRLESQLQQTEKMEAIATLAGGVAHEFNNALMGIMGTIELLKMDLSENEKRGKYFDTMKRSSHRMSRLTDQLLAYAQGGKYQPKDLKLDDFVMETVPILKYDLSSEVRLETHFPKGISHIKADYSQMQMILSGMVANSNEAIEGEGFIRITAENKDVDEDFAKQHPGLKPGRYVCFTIEDDGKGMDEETRSGIFEPFFTTKFQGRGMGMAAVYGIVKNHDGCIYVDSELGKGTVVQIYLPAIEIEVEKAIKAKTEVVAGSGTILMIEDEDVVIEVTQAMLEMLGYRVMAAKTGKDAIHIAETFDGQIDLALLDIKLPDMEGGKVYPLIMEARPNLKVIVFSGYSIDGPARKILDAGAQDFIQKPFSLATLSEKLKEVLEGQ